MNSLTVRITRSAHATLRALAEESDESMTEILDKAIEAYRRQSFLAGLNSDFDALRRKTAAWEEEQAERKQWDVTLSDGLKE
jgi:hypothetical protein